MGTITSITSKTLEVLLPLYFITYKNSKNTLFLSMSKNILFQLKLEIDKVRTKRWCIPPDGCNQEIIDPPSVRNGCLFGITIGPFEGNHGEQTEDNAYPLREGQ